MHGAVPDAVKTLNGVHLRWSPLSDESAARYFDAGAKEA